MSTAPATLSSSSSASSRLNWQPSQEANLKIAILGLPLGLVLVSELILLQQRPDALVRENGPIFADEVWSVLAMPTEADPALHVSFHGNVNIVLLEPLRFQLSP